MTVFIAQGRMRWPLRCRAQALANYGWNVRDREQEGDQTPARTSCEARKREAGNTGGRFKCVSGRQLARTRQVSAKATIPGDTQQTDKSIACGTQASSCFCGGLSQAAARRVPDRHATRPVPLALEAQGAM